MQEALLMKEELYESALRQYIGKDMLDRLTSAQFLKIGGKRVDGYISYWLFEYSHDNPLNEVATFTSCFDIIFDEIEYCNKGYFINSDLNYLWAYIKEDYSQFDIIRNVSEKIIEKRIKNLKFKMGLHYGKFVMGNFGAQKRHRYMGIGIDLQLIDLLTHQSEESMKHVYVTEAAYKRQKEKPKYDRMLTYRIEALKEIANVYKIKL
jgi:hypothetical protein